MTGFNEADTAPARAQEQRFRLKGLLQINHEICKGEDLALAEKVLAAATPADYDAWLTDPAVQRLFAGSMIFVRCAGDAPPTP